MFIAVLFTIAKIWKQPQCQSVNKWIKQLWYIYTIEYHFTIKKEEKFTLRDNMEGPAEIYTK